LNNLVVAQSQKKKGENPIVGFDGELKLIVLDLVES
jgi:hypothetical protein